MLRHQQRISSAMKQANFRKYHHFQRQFLNILMLSIMWTMLFTQTMARPTIEDVLFNTPRNDVSEQQQQEPPDIYLNEIITNINNEKLFNKMQKYHHNRPNYLNKWPGLRNLVRTLDYDDNNDLEESSEFLNTRFLDRLRQLASPKTDYVAEALLNSGDAILTPAKTLNSSTSLTFKDHNIKKNVHYMSPCHFKICNMGGKRDSRFLRNN